MKKILLIENDEITYRLIEKVLNYRGYEVIHARNAESGIDLIQQQQPAAILLDIGLGGLDGKVVVNYVENMLQIYHIPVIALTDDTTVETRQEALAFGCEVVIHKPIDILDFVDQIAAYLPYTEVW